MDKNAKKFSDEILVSLEDKVKETLSSARYLHTVGVKRAAVKIAEYCYDGDMSEIIAAALLHDVAKEMPIDLQREIIKESGIVLTDSDLMSEQILHSFAAPEVIKKTFPKFATENILSATFNHTTGSPDMTLFDEIIFIADYIEEGRTYASCVETRNYLYNSFSKAKTVAECQEYLHVAVFNALEYTISSLLYKKQIISERTVTTRNAFLTKTQMLLSETKE